jgi:hypothetical protein
MHSTSSGFPRAHFPARAASEMDLHRFTRDVGNGALTARRFMTRFRVQIVG